MVELGEARWHTARDAELGLWLDAIAERTQTLKLIHALCHRGTGGRRTWWKRYNLNRLGGGIGAGCAGTAARRLIADLAESERERAAEGCAGRCRRASRLMVAAVIGSDLMGAVNTNESV
jgi:hypothetical protein